MEYPLSVEGKTRNQHRLTDHYPEYFMKYPDYPNLFN
jgi:hypothetical protein